MKRMARNSARLIVIAALTPAINACGGGSSAGELAVDFTISPSTHKQTENLSVVTSRLETKWAPPPGIELLSADLVKESVLHVQKPSISLFDRLTKTQGQDKTVLLNLQFDFGCNTANVKVKTADCRNVVAATTIFTAPVPVANQDTLYIEARNRDLYADFAIRMRDKSGQTIQYPLQIRSITETDPSAWVLARVPLKEPTLYWGGANNGIIQDSISELSVIAFPRNNSSATAGLNYPKGQIEIKGARLVRNHTPVYTLSENSAVARGSFYPTTTGRLAIAHNNFDREPLEKAKEAGFSVIRRDLFWQHIEKENFYKFEGFKAGANNLEPMGFKVLWILDYGHPEHGGSTPKTASDIRAFTRFSRAAFSAWKDYPVLGYEIWNEPDTEMFWPEVDVNRYAELLKQTTAALRAESPSVKILSGGVGISDPAYLFKLAKTGALRDVDAIGIHPYRYDTQTQASPKYRRFENSPEAYAADKLIVQNYLAAAGVNKPLANTEWGYSTKVFLDENVYGHPHGSVALERHANLTLRMVLTQLATNEPLITVFRLMDKASDPNDKEMNFGLLDSRMNEKPAFKSLVALNRLTQNMAYQGPLMDTPPSVYGVVWSSGNQKAFAVWTESESASILKIPPGTLEIKDMTGRPISPETWKDSRTIKITEQIGPIFLITK